MIEKIPSNQSQEYAHQPNRYAVEPASPEEQASIRLEAEAAEIRVETERSDAVKDARSAVEAAFAPTNEMIENQITSQEIMEFDDDSVISRMNELGINANDANRFLDSLYGQTVRLKSKKPQRQLSKEEFIGLWVKKFQSQESELEEFLGLVYENSIPSREVISDIEKTPTASEQNEETVSLQSLELSDINKGLDHLRNLETRDRIDTDHLIDAVSKLRSDLNGYDSSGRDRLGFSDAVARTRGRIDDLSSQLTELQKRRLETESLAFSIAESNGKAELVSKNSDDSLINASNRMKNVDIRQSTPIQDIVGTLGSVNTLLRQANSGNSYRASLGRTLVRR